MANDPFWRLLDAAEFTLTSPDVVDGDVLPHWARSGITGAGGEDVSPALEWSGAPEGTRSFVLTCYDPDAPTQAGWWHWAVHGIPAGVTSLPRNAGDPAAGLLPAGAVTLRGDAMLTRYHGASPPAGHGAHRYYFTVFATDLERVDVPADASPTLLTYTIHDHTLGRASLSATSETP